MTTMLICIVYCISNMYIVAIFALALLSPLPFVSPFMYDSQDAMAQEPPFGQGEDVQNPTSSTQPDSTFTGSTSESNSTDSQPISPQELTITSLTSSSNNTNSSKEYPKKQFKGGNPNKNNPKSHPQNKKHNSR